MVEIVSQMLPGVCVCVCVCVCQCLCVRVCVCQCLCVRDNTWCCLHMVVLVSVSAKITFGLKNIRGVGDKMAHKSGKFSKYYISTSMFQVSLIIHHNLIILSQQIVSLIK